MMAVAQKFAGTLAFTTALAFAVAFLGAVPSRAQNPGNGNSGVGGAGTPHMHMGDDPIDGPAGDPVFQERRIRQISIATHKSMVSDTDKLLELATELSKEIGDTNPRSFTPDQLRKIAQIEKLAHNVKDKMRMSLQSPQDGIMAMPDLPRAPH
jgi:hypothetical protein